MDRPISLIPVTPVDDARAPGVSLVLVAVVALALMATAFIGLPDLATPTLDIVSDAAGALAPPF